MNELKLFKQWMPLGYKIAHSFSRAHPHYSEEITNAALMGVWESVQLEQKSKAKNFKKFAGGVITNTINKELKDISNLSDRAQRKVKRGELKVTYHSIDDDSSNGNSITNMGQRKPNEFMERINAMSSLETSEDLYIDFDMINKISKIIDEALCKEDRQIIKDHYFEGKEMSEIGRDAGVSRSRIHQKKNRALKKMKDHLEGNLTKEMIG